MRLINADAFEVVITKIPDGMDTESYIAGMDFVLDKIDNAPTIEPERKGWKWIRLTKDLAQCSKCGDYVDNATRCGYNFCPNCGADMRGEQE